MPELRLHAIVDTVVDGIILMDPRGRVTMFNPACERMFGYAASEIIGGDVKVLMPPPYHGEHDQYLENYRKTGRKKIIGIGREVLGRRKTGETFPLDLSVGAVSGLSAAVMAHHLNEHMLETLSTTAEGQVLPRDGIPYDGPDPMDRG